MGYFAGRYEIPTEQPHSLFMKITIPLLVTLASAQIASAASYTNYSSIAVAGNNFSNYNVQQFDSTLGTLTGVQVTVPLSDLQGSVTVTNGLATVVNVSQFDSALTVQQSGSLGYTTEHDTIYSVVTSPDWNTTNIPAYSPQLFSISGGQSFSVSSQSIASTYFGAYESAGATGNETFQIKNVQSITTTGAIYTVDSSAAGTNSQVAVTYTYTPIPEPSAGLLGGLGLLGLVRRRR